MFGILKYMLGLRHLHRGKAHRKGLSKHKEHTALDYKPIIITNILWLIVNGLVTIGAIIY